MGLQTLSGPGEHRLRPEWLSLRGIVADSGPSVQQGRAADSGPCTPTDPKLGHVGGGRWEPRAATPTSPFSTPGPAPAGRYRSDPLDGHRVLLELALPLASLPPTKRGAVSDLRRAGSEGTGLTPTPSLRFSPKGQRGDFSRQRTPPLPRGGPAEEARADRGRGRAGGRRETGGARRRGGRRSHQTGLGARPHSSPLLGPRP